MKRYEVRTHNGVEYTRAKSARGAINNVRWRMFGNSFNGVKYAESWTAREVA